MKPQMEDSFVGLVQPGTLAMANVANVDLAVIFIRAHQVTYLVLRT